MLSTDLYCLFYCQLPYAHAKCHPCNLVAFSVHSNEEYKTGKDTGQKKAKLL